MEVYCKTGSQARQAPRQAWTASRCIRLLRPLSAKVLALRGDTKSIHLNKSGINVEEKAHFRRQSLSDPYSEHSDGAESVWSQQEYGNRNKRKYGLRCNRRDRITQNTNKKRKLDKPGHTEANNLPFASPFLRKIRHQFMTEHEDDQCPSGLSEYDVKPLPEFRPADFRCGMTNRRAGFQRQGVFEMFILLMQATAPSESEETCKYGIKSKSLFATCIHQIPAYISYESLLRKRLDAEDQTNVSAEVYDELEELQNVIGCAPPLLRLMLRSHAIQLTAESIREELLDFATIAKLISWCTSHGHVMAQDVFLSALTSRCCVLELRNGKHTQRCVQTIVTEAFFRQLPLAAQFKHLRGLLNSPITKISQFALPEFETLFGSALLCLMRGNDTEEYFEAVQVLERFFEKACDSRDDDHSAPSICECTSTSIVDAESDASFIKFFTAMCAVCVGHMLSLSCERAKSRVHRPLEFAAASISNRKGLKNHVSQATVTSPTGDKCAAILLLSDLLAVLCNNEDNNEYDEVNESRCNEKNFVNRRLPQILHYCDMIISSSKAGSEATSMLANLVSLTAAALQRLTGARNDTPLRRLVSALQRQTTHNIKNGEQDFDGPRITSSKTSADCRVQLGWFIECMILEASINFAQDPKMPSATALVAQLERVFASNSQREEIMTASHPLTESDSDGEDCRASKFRWEQGICEWVSRTPMASIARTKVKDRIITKGSRDHDRGQQETNITTASNTVIRRSNQFGLISKLDLEHYPCSEAGTDNQELESEDELISGTIRIRQHVVSDALYAPVCSDLSSAGQLSHDNVMKREREDDRSSVYESSSGTDEVTSDTDVTEYSEDELSLLSNGLTSNAVQNPTALSTPN